MREIKEMLGGLGIFNFFVLYTKQKNTLKKLNITFLGCLFNKRFILKYVEFPEL